MSKTPRLASASPAGFAMKSHKRRVIHSILFVRPGARQLHCLFCRGVAFVTYLSSL
jgi:hypothetical protein